MTNLHIRKTSSGEELNISLKNFSAQDFLWLSIALLPLLLIAFLLPITMQDYWWYLRLGKDIVSGGGVPNIDTYSFTHLGEPIINLTWLSAVLLWFAYSVGGITGTFLLRGLVIGLSYGTLWVLLRQCGGGRRMTSLLVIVAGLSGSNNWSFRPQMFSYPLFIVTLFVLSNWQNGRNKNLWMLPILAFLWANLHGSFLMMFILAFPAIFFGKGDRKVLAQWTFAAFLATLINPYGLILWESILHSLISPLSFNLSTEWAPPVNLGWQMNIYFGWLLILMFLPSISPIKLSALEWLWLLGLGWMSLSGLRFVIWELFIFSLCTTRLLAGLNTSWIETTSAPKKPLLNFLMGILILLVSIAALPGLRQSMGLKEPPAVSLDTPVTAVTWLARHDKLPGPMWNDVSYGSYLIFALPSRPVWIDTRFEMIYPASQYLKFIKIAQAEPGWEDLLQKEGINLLFLSVDGESILMANVENSSEWCQQYRDEIAVIFSRCNPIQ